MTWLATLIAAGAVLTWLHYSCTGVWWLATGERMASFDAAAPFQYRVLLPALVAVLHGATGVEVETAFVLLEVCAWVALVLVAERALVAFDIGATRVRRRWLATTVLIPVGVHLILPDLRIVSFFDEGGGLDLAEWHLTDLFRYVYDLPAAVLVLALVVLLRRFAATLDRRWLAWYVGLFALATLNRETTVFLLPAFAAVCFRLLDRTALTALLFLQVALVFGIESALQTIFAANVNPNASVPGTAYENHLAFNLALLSEPAYLAVFLLRFTAALYIPVLLLWRYLDPLLRRTLIWFGLPFLASAAVFGRIQEHRVTAEVVPLVWLAAVQAIAAYHAFYKSLVPPVSPEGDKAAPGAATAVRSGQAG